MTAEVPLLVSPLVTRDEARHRLMTKWAKAKAAMEEVGLDFDEPRWDALRNYELERMMEYHFGGEWVIAEWCPFDGIFCRYKEVAPAADLIEAKNNIAAMPENTGLNKPYLLRLLDEQLEAREA